MSSGSVIGPSLPDHLRKRPLEEDDHERNPTEDHDSELGTVNATENQNETASNSDSDDDFGPALPPSFNESLEQAGQKAEPLSTEREDNQGPVVGPVFSDLSEEPLPKRSKSGRTSDDSKKVQREEWMTMIPEVLTKNFGSGPRKFDTSAKSKIPIDADEAERASRDFEQERIARDLSSNRKASLLDDHRKGKSEKEEKETKEIERVPFDRERDMKSKLLDSEAKNKLIKNCQNFSSRFSSSKTSKYL
ncbi:GPALPP motifs-containing protein 1-like [Convolutriloba macropyga]|uniref:GPALPP motifs-containing protein 1-like n=1 Tax=Convolutriloba macropyga TaxID=536237 RepID=UPI003F51EF04